MKRPYLEPEMDLKIFLAKEMVATLSLEGILGSESEWQEGDEDGDEI